MSCFLGLMAQGSFWSFLEVQIDGLFAGGKIICSVNSFLEVADPIPSLE